MSECREGEDMTAFTMRRVRNEIIEECVKAALSKRFGPPSMWSGQNPPGWHLDRECTPTDASMHDNGCIDAAKGIRKLQDI